MLVSLQWQIFRSDSLEWSRWRVVSRWFPKMVVVWCGMCLLAYSLEYSFRHAVSLVVMNPKRNSLEHSTISNKEICCTRYFLVPNSESEALMFFSVAMLSFRFKSSSRCLLLLVRLRKIGWSKHVLGWSQIKQLQYSRHTRSLWFRIFQSLLMLRVSLPSCVKWIQLTKMWSSLDSSQAIWFFYTSDRKEGNSH